VSGIYFFNEDVNYRVRDIRKVRNWIKAVIDNEGGQLENINFILTSDRFLHQLNIDYLQHDTLTDIITFDYNEGIMPIISDIYISIDRCKENAGELKQSTRNELHRLFVHGVLHLLGYKDKSNADKQEMTAKEDYYLSLRAEFDL
jgi:rRNA maturation RNase YbeY